MKPESDLVIVYSSMNSMNSMNSRSDSNWRKRMFIHRTR